MFRRKNQELFSERQVKIWTMECAALQADTVTGKNVLGGIQLRKDLSMSSTYSAIRLLMEVFTKRPRGHRSAHRS